jgi:hypothetical protein
MYSTARRPEHPRAAYTNGFNGATTTTLYDISGTTDQLFTQNPPNGGTLILVGSLGVDATDVNGFDILLSDNYGLRRNDCRWKRAACIPSICRTGRRR